MKLVLRLVTILLLVSATSALAQITIVARWRLGENDPGATSGAGTTNPTQDASPNNWDLNKDGATVYSSDTPSASMTPLGASTLSMSFPGNSTYAGYSIGINGWVENMPAYSQNFVLEGWFKPANTAAGDRVLFGMGQTNTGYYLMQNGSNLEVRYGSSGSAVITYSALAAGVWTHVAISADTTTAYLYVNGTNEGSYATASMPDFGTNSAYFGLGELAPSPGGENFVGLIDEVRYFQYSGTFNTGMLNFTAVPEPSAYAVVAGVVGLVMAIWRRRNAA